MHRLIGAFILWSIKYKFDAKKLRELLFSRNYVRRKAGQGYQDEANNNDNNSFFYKLFEQSENGTVWTNKGHNVFYDNNGNTEYNALNINNYNCPECWWLNNDEYITADEGIWRYRLGEGKTLFVKLNKLNLSKVKVSDFSKTKLFHQGYPMIYANFDQDYYTNLDQAIVYDSIALVYLGDNTVMALPDEYDFRMNGQKSFKGLIRDFATFLGGAYNNWGINGQSYYIVFKGTAKIEN